MKRALVPFEAVYGNLRVHVESISQDHDDWVVPVEPERYPESMYDFYDALARAESVVRDAGVSVRLTPRIRQRMLFVAAVPGHPEIVFESEDGAEYDELARLLNVSKDSLGPVLVEGYPFDSAKERAEVIDEARQEHPHADFSRLAS